MSDGKPDAVCYESWLTKCLDFFEQLPQNEQEKTVSLLLNKCSFQSKLKLRNDMTTFDFISELPTEIFEYILDYLPLVDALIACHVCPLWNDRISMLDFHWKKRWMKLTNSEEATFQTKDWKRECEQLVGRSLILTEDDDLCDTPDEYYSPIEISAMDYCDGLLLCFGSPVQIPLSDVSDDTGLPAQSEGIAYLYKATDEIWEQVGVIKPLPQGNPAVTSCLLTPELAVAGRSNGSIIIWNMQLTSSKTYEFSFFKNLLAHTGDITSVCYDKGLNMLVTAGLDDLVKVWDFSDWSVLKMLGFQGIRGASLLTGERSPLDGYHAIVIPIYDGVEYSTALLCWGGQISLRNALRSHILLDRSKDADCGFVLMPHVFVEGGSLVYAAGHDPAFCWCDDEEETGDGTCTLIWKPITPFSFISGVANDEISDEEIERFFDSLRPAREEFLPLPSGTECLVAVGRCFSVVLINNTPNLTLVANDTGETGRLLSARHEFGIFGEKFTMACTKWMNGTNLLKPNSICFARSFYEGRLITWKWKHEGIFVENTPSLSDLLSLRNKTSADGLPVLSCTWREDH